MKKRNSRNRRKDRNRKGKDDMTFADLLTKVGTAKCDERRSVTDDYCEVVVSADGLKEFNEILRSYFGPPQEMKGGRFSSEAELQAGPYGGIRTGQSMYLRNREAGPELALLWPWSSGQAVTVKIIRQK
jgi:hypothetical protein